MIHLRTLALAALLAGCEAQTPPPPVTFADSAGVRVVTNHDGFDVATWALGTPLLELGAVDEGPEQFFRVITARRTPRHIVVADGGSSEIRVFTSEGRHVTSFGREGDGPGEFRFIRGAWVGPADSIAVWDLRLRRLSFFDADGRFGRSVDIGAGMPNPDVVVLTEEGRSIVSSEMFRIPEGSDFETIYSAFYIVDEHGEVVDSLARQPLSEIGRLGEEGMIGTPLFGTVLAASGDRDGYWLGSGRTEEIRRFSSTGDPTLVTRWPATDRRVTPSDVEAALEAEVARASPENEARVRRLFQNRPVADHFPAHGPLLASTDGSVWVQDYSLPGVIEPTWWTVFDAEGRRIARILVPERTRIVEVGHDHVLAVHRDDFDIEYVQLFGLVRPTE